MQVMSLVWGILAFLGMIAGFLPCLVAVNWVNIPFAVIGLVISTLALVSRRGGAARGGAIVGLACCCLAVGVGVIRLTLSNGAL